jgi:expansin (peptidoglycan-binding protein)
MSNVGSYSLSILRGTYTAVDNGKHIDVTIGDLCVGCGTDSIDLSQGAFATLADLDVGVIPIQWNLRRKNISHASFDDCWGFHSCLCL